MNKTLIKERNSYSLFVLVLTIFLILSIIVAVTIGSTNLQVSSVYDVIFKEIRSIFTNTPQEYNTTRDIVIFIRLPRILLAAIVGIALSVCGVVMQAIVKNPLADPYILGVSSGASLGATLAILLGIGTIFGANFIGIMGFLGAFLVSITVLLLSNVGSRSNTLKLLLSGMALNSLCSAFSSFIVYFANDAEGIKTITYWLMGSMSSANYPTIFVLLPIILICIIFFFFNFRILNLMLLGDDTAVTLGTNLSHFRNIFLLISSLMIGFVVYASGMIGFVGLIIPHISRFLVGTNHKRLLPVCALLGGILLVWADVLCRIIIDGNEIPIGILISVIGAPCFIYLLAKKSYTFGGN